MALFKEHSVTFLHRKIPWIIILVSVVFLIVAGRLYYLQVLQGQHYNDLATEIFIREEELVAKRGNIVDRFGKVIADSRAYFEITITPQYVSNGKKVIRDIVEILPEISADDIQKELSNARYEPKFKPVSVVKDVPYELVAKLQEYLAPVYDENSPYDLSGVSVRYIPMRRYIYPHLFSHSLGYLKEIDKPGLKKAKKKYPGLFSLGDLTGAAGVERTYDVALKGLDGVWGRVVDARGREIQTKGDLQLLRQQVSNDPISGYTLRTSLDFRAQKVAQDALTGKHGAVVAMDPNTGEVIALYSSPGFDANRLGKIVDKKYWAKINLDEDKYLFNRATQAMYPPASTYKVVALSAGINTGKIDPQKTYFTCRGGMSFGNRFFKCWNKGGHGRVNAVRALAQSCDVYFYRLGLMLGVDGLAKYARIFGLGQKTGIDIPYETSGLVPTQKWKETYRKEKWMESETLSVAIGQSYNLTTPIQNAVVASMVANGGYRVRPHIGLEVLDHQGTVIKKIPVKKEKTMLAGTDALKWVQKGMIEVIHGAGTAKRLRRSPYKIAGKTGTAQVVGHDSKVRGKKAVAHALFISYAPYYDPKIAVAVMVEHGRGGSSTAAPIAQRVIDTYMDHFHGPF